MRYRWAVALSAIVVTAIPGLAGAQDAGTSAIDPLLRCRAIADHQERLACFDRVSATLGEAVASGSLVVLDRQTVRATRRSLFGLDINLPFFRGSKEEEPEPREITAKANFIREIGIGYWLVGLDNGAIRQTTEPRPRLSPPRVGDEITIRKGAAGGYFLKSGSSLIRAKRTK